MKWEISVNGRVLDLDPAQSTTAEWIEPGVYSVLQGGRSFEVRIAPASGGWIVQIGGKQFSVEVQDPREAGGRSRGALGHGRQSIIAPMPGKVIRVLVQEGAQVEAGQGIIVVEAMKMQNEMKAAHAGTVVQVRAKDGDTVGAGDVLMVLE
jgi:biotin carboxyl carrier protein